METPVEPTVRRSTRSALMEIPARMGALALSVNIQEFQTPGWTNVNNNNNIPGGPMAGLLVETNLPGSYLTPSPSPDELVIQQRGRRKAPVTWSPDIDAASFRDHHPFKEHTPVKHQGKSSIVLRSTPRKRLLLNDPMELSPSPKKDRLMPINKKCRLEPTVPVVYGTLESALRALSTDQLVSVIRNLVLKHPYLEQEVKNDLPVPDLRPLEDKLSDLKRNIFKSLPNSRLTSKTDSPAFNRASTHVLAFKKCVQEQGKTLVNSQQWDTVCDYILMAWRHVNSTPLWDNPPHNAARKQCFKFLAAQCMTALKRVQWDNEKITEFHSKLSPFVADSEDIQSCLKQLENMKKTVE